MSTTLLSDIILGVEKVWYKPIKNYITTLYVGTHLPSHDVGHHIRVWEICKVLMFELNECGFLFAKSFVENAIVASLFHDTGLIVDRSEKHGLASKKFCEQFFKENPTFTLSEMDITLDAIEHHDDKSLKEIKSISISEGVSLTRLVSSADDLDAYGYIGIYRYLEIYLLRGIQFEEVPKKIMVNLTGRFANFENYFSTLPSLVEFHRERYFVTYHFFEILDKQLSEKRGKNCLEVALFLKECLIDNQMSILQTIDSIKNDSSSISIKEFAKNLENEFSEYI